MADPVLSPTSSSFSPSPLSHRVDDDADATSAPAAVMEVDDDDDEDEPNLEPDLDLDYDHDLGKNLAVEEAAGERWSTTSVGVETVNKRKDDLDRDCDLDGDLGNDLDKTLAVEEATGERWSTTSVGVETVNKRKDDLERDLDRDCDLDREIDNDLDHKLADEEPVGERWSTVSVGVETVNKRKDDLDRDLDRELDSELDRDLDPGRDIDRDLDLDEEEDVESSSEQGGQAEQKRSLDRFAFIKLARVEPKGAGRYEIFSEVGLPILHARVRDHPAATGGGGCCRGGASGGSGSQRPFMLQVSDFSSRQTVMRLLCDRHCAITVESPPHEAVGYLTAERILCSLRFTVRDLHGNPRLLVRCPSYCEKELAEARCQPRRAHRVMLADESAEVARLNSMAATGAGGSGFRNHILEVPGNMSTDLKAMLIGVALLFDRKLLA